MGGIKVSNACEKSNHKFKQKKNSKDENQKKLPREKDLEGLELVEPKGKGLTPTNRPSSSSSSSSSSSKSESSLNFLKPASKSSSKKNGFFEPDFLKFGQSISAVTRREPTAAAGMKSEIIAPPHIFLLSLSRTCQIFVF